MSIKQLSLLLVVTFACGGPDPQAVAEAQAFLDSYNDEFLGLYYESAQAEWQSNTEIIEGDTTNAYRTNTANEAMAAFTGSIENIEKAQALLALRDTLEPLQVKQLEAVLYSAANNPQTVSDLVSERIAAETE